MTHLMTAERIAGRSWRELMAAGRMLCSSKLGGKAEAWAMSSSLEILSKVEGGRFRMEFLNSRIGEAVVWFSMVPGEDGHKALRGEVEHTATAEELGFF